jgi:hypothetical protein
LVLLPPNFHHFRDLHVLIFIDTGHFYSHHDQIGLSEIIPDMHCLEILDISYYYLDISSPHRMLKVLQAVSGSSVTSLNIEATGFTTISNKLHDEYYPALKALIEPSSGKLRELFVGDYDSDCHDNTGLMELLSSSSSLETLHLIYLPLHCLIINEKH